MFKTYTIHATDGSPKIINNIVPVCLLYVHHLILFSFVNINNDAPSRWNNSSDELKEKLLFIYMLFELTNAVWMQNYYLKSNFNWPTKYQ